MFTRLLFRLFNKGPWLLWLWLTNEIPYMLLTLPCNKINLFHIYHWPFAVPSPTENAIRIEVIYGVLNYFRAHFRSLWIRLWTVMCAHRRHSYWGPFSTKATPQSVRYGFRPGGASLQAPDVNSVSTRTDVQAQVCQFMWYILWNIFNF